MSDVLRVEAPAKLNLGLRVLGRRADGYHLLDSVFIPLALADGLEVRLLPPGEPRQLDLRGAAPDVPSDERNLALRAAVSFLARAGRADGLTLVLHKRIPSAAGLGGGSSDAGTVLRTLARLLPDAVSPEGIQEIALGLGADVPYFLDPRPARVGGIGERVEPLADLPSVALLLVNPGVPLATAEVFAAYDAAAARGGALTDGEAAPTFRALSLANDLEPAASMLCPALAGLRRALVRVGAKAVGLSGSGPTLFGVFDSEDAAREAQGRIGLDPPALCIVTSSRASGASPNW